MSPFGVKRRGRHKSGRRPFVHFLGAACIAIKGNDVELKSQGIQAVALLVDVLTEDQFEAFRNILRSHVLQACALRELPIPQMGIGVEERETGLLG